MIRVIVEMNGWKGDRHISASYGIDYDVLNKQIRPGDVFLYLFDMVKNAISRGEHFLETKMVTLPLPNIEK